MSDTAAIGRTLAGDVVMVTEIDGDFVKGFRLVPVVLPREDFDALDGVPAEVIDIAAAVMPRAMSAAAMDSMLETVDKGLVRPLDQLQAGDL